MGKKDSKPVLWENVHALMTAAYGAERLGQFARDCHLGPATMTRIKAKETSVGLDVLDSIASRFNLEPWQLLAPQSAVEAGHLPAPKAPDQTTPPAAGRRAAGSETCRRATPQCGARSSSRDLLT